MKKKILAALLTLAAIFGLSACSDDETTYPPVESTKEEMKTVMTLSFDAEEYDIPYELYRAFFLQYKSVIDGGDEEVWQSENKAKYIEEIDSLIISKIASIYSVLHVSKKAGIDPYSKDFDEQVAEYITISVEGGSFGNTVLEGFGGDYDKYLLSLKEMNLNYSVTDLLLRYSLAQERVRAFYAGDPDSNDPEKADGALDYTREDVKAFYDGSESARIIRAFFASEAFSEERVNEIRDSISSKNSESAVASYIIQFSLTGGEDIKNGEVLGKYSLDAAYYSEITAATFELVPGETGEVIRLITDKENGYTVIYRAEKSDEHFDKCYDSIASVYVENEIGRLFHSAETALKESAEYTDFLNGLDRSSISMD